MLSNEDRKTQSYHAGLNGDVLPPHGDWLSHLDGRSRRVHAARADNLYDVHITKSGGDGSAGIVVLLVLAWYALLCAALLYMLLMHVVGTVALALLRALFRTAAQLRAVRLGFVKRLFEAMPPDGPIWLDRAQAVLDELCAGVIGMLPFTSE